jgi:integrase
MPKSLTVADCVRQGAGRYNFGHSLYLIIRGASALWEKQFRQDGKLRTKCYGSAVGAAPVSLTQARALDAADWLERRGQRQVTTNARFHNGTHNGNGNGAASKLFSVARDEYFRDKQGGASPQWTTEQYETLTRMLAKHASTLDDKRVDRITLAEMADMLRPIWKGPGSHTGNRVRGLVEKILRSAGIKNDDNPALWENLESKLSDKVAKSVSRSMMPLADIPAFMAKLATDDSVQSRALQFIVLTAARQDEALEAVAGEFDLAGKTWTIPAERMKMQRQHIVPLSDAAMNCLGTLHGGLVFPSKLGTRLSQQTTRELVPGATVHGFRAALTSWAQSKGYDKEVRDFAIAHYPTDPNDKAYERADLLDLRRKMIVEWAAFVTGKPIA